MQGNAEIHHAMINGTHHIVVPTITKIPIQTLVDAGDRPTEFETGTVASQSYYRGVNFDGHQMLDQHYLSEDAYSVETARLFRFYSPIHSVSIRP